MSRHHQNHHHHVHGHSNKEIGEHPEGPSETDKIVRMVEHWIHHNEEHAKSYHSWADRARKADQEQVGRMLDDIAEGALLQNQSFLKILEVLKGE